MGVFSPFLSSSFLQHMWSSNENSPSYVVGVFVFIVVIIKDIIAPYNHYTVPCLSLAHPSSIVSIDRKRLPQKPSGITQHTIRFHLPAQSMNPSRRLHQADALPNFRGLLLLAVLIGCKCIDLVLLGFRHPASDRYQSRFQESSDRRQLQLHS